jgi:hypothetical protein
MNRYHLEVIKGEDSSIAIIEADGYNVNSTGCYQFFDEYGTIIRIIASYPIGRTIIQRVEYNIQGD